jgi:oxygen-independent coproporphyrinogen-3 oxidase
VCSKKAAARILALLLTMAGIYIHIPFCRKACTYCNFYFSTLLKRKPELLEAIKTEAALRKDFFGEEQITTVYFGGGTPSLLSADEINDLWSALQKHFDLSSVEEVTLEANPEDLTLDYLQQLTTTAVNRLSIGIQSFSDDDLKFLGRIHDARRALNAVHRAADTGYVNLSIDLIYGIPGMSLLQWKKNLQIAFSLPIKHLSCYSLTVEEKTLLAWQIRRKKIPPPDDAHSASHFEWLCRMAEQQQWDHYEISNLACTTPYRSAHNCSYWNGTSYLGLGPSAHSFRQTIRWWNTANNSNYMNCIRQGRLPCQSEILTPEMQYNEYVMTRLRLAEGISKTALYHRFGKTFYEHFENEFKNIPSGFYYTDGQNIRLSPEGKLFADRIASDLFITAATMNKNINSY